jgi:23S rRNA pseudouridine2604 synthase
MTDQPKKTLQLSTKPSAKPVAPRAPVRPRGPARARPLSEVQAERAARDAAWEARNTSGDDRRRPADGAPWRTGPAPAPEAPRSGALRPPRPPHDPRPDLARVGNANGEVRLNKRMADLGLCSRREADEWIARGWVRVNGQPAVMGQPVPPDAQVEVLPQARHQQAGQVTILLHKPVGYVSGLPEDGHESAAVLIKPQSHWREDRSGRRFEAVHTRGLAPAGRLDIDSTGLLVLTQDGRVARTLIGEDSGVEKEYLVRVHWAPNGPKGRGRGHAGGAGRLPSRAPGPAAPWPELGRAAAKTGAGRLAEPRAAALCAAGRQEASDPPHVRAGRPACGRPQAHPHRAGDAGQPAGGAVALPGGDEGF